MWSFKIVLGNKECDLKLCKDVSEYIKNTDGCRGTTGVYKSLAIGLSLIPLTGISNFYCGNILNGIFEAIEGLIILFAIGCCCCYFCEDTLDDNIDIPFLLCESFCSLLLAAINILRYAICQLDSIDSFKLYEFSLMMTSLAISLIFCCCGYADKRGWITSIIINAIVVGLMEVIRDVYMDIYNENDGNGCPFI